MSRKSRKKREKKLLSQIERRQGARRLGGRPRAVRYQDTVRGRCPRCARKEGDVHSTDCETMSEEVEYAQLVEARQKRQWLQGEKHTIADKPRMLTHGPAVSRRRAEDMLARLRDEDLTLYGARQVMGEARDGNLNKRDRARVEAEAKKKVDAIQEKRDRENRHLRARLRAPRKWFRPGKKL